MVIPDIGAGKRKAAYQRWKRIGMKVERNYHAREAHKKRRRKNRTGNRAP